MRSGVAVEAACGAGPPLNLYAESSAVLSWLLGEPEAEPVRQSLAEAELVLASELTLIECERALVRAVSTGALLETTAADRRLRLRSAAEHWTLLGFAPDVVERAKRAFPVEPIRTLDALHLSYALFARSLAHDTRLLSRDRRIRSAARELGFEVLPAAS